MNRVEIIDKFVPQGCAGTVSAVPAVSAGAGAVWSDLYHAVTTKAGRYVQGGGCTDVGVAGLVQSGGFGSFSKGFGLTAAGLLEAEVVCFDGQLRVANACTNPELFWALKGGGGGSWGVVTKVVLRTHDLPKYFGYVGGKIRAKSDSAFATLVTRVMDFYADQLFNPHWGEQISLGTDRSLKLSLCSQGLSNEQVMAVWKPFSSLCARCRSTMKRLKNSAPVRGTLNLGGISLGTPHFGRINVQARLRTMPGGRVIKIK